MVDKYLRRQLIFCAVFGPEGESRGPKRGSNLSRVAIRDGHCDKLTHDGELCASSSFVRVQSHANVLSLWADRFCLPSPTKAVQILQGQNL
ncbi:hypothetical protein Zmor_022346 [Zophobas morio]|uniref:Uncharacterized protein n=1 Tax=Zophobas morio TaxID=2755281 RepID=A0AA38HWF2_9CUCU|nr:hypothetical protein Zmor_022346 [Zophobas morio]